MNIPEKLSNSGGLIPFGFRPFAVILSFILFTLLGFVVMPLLPLKLYPSEKGQQIYINFSIPGYKPDVVEMEVTAPIESVISLIDGIEKIESTSGEGWGQIVIEVKKGFTSSKVKREIVAAIRQIYPTLPRELLFPEVSGTSKSEAHKKQLLVYTLWGNRPTWEIKQVAAELVISQLNAIEGIASAEIQGATDLIWEVRLDYSAMQRLRLTPSQVASALNDYFLNMGVGVIASGDCYSSTLAVAGPGIDGANWDSIPVAFENGRIIYLGQIASIGQVQSVAEREFRINGKPAVYLVISSSPDVNQIKLANQIYERIESVKKCIPDLQFSKTYDSTEQLRIDLKKNIIRTIASLCLLLIFVLLAYRKLRYLVIIIITLTANIAIAALLYFLFKIEIHLFSLSGFALSLGLIIDNTLVTLDHLKDKHNMKIFTALLAATLTTVAALASIFFMKADLVQNLKDFAWVIIVSLGVSLLISLFLIPALFQAFPFGYKSRKMGLVRVKFLARVLKLYSRYCQFAQRHKGLGLTFGLLSIGIPVFLLPDKVDGNSFWATTYNKTIGSQVYQYTLKPIVDKALGGTLRLFYHSAWANHYWDIPQRTKLTVIYKLPDGTTLQQADAIAKIFESHISATAGVENFITNVTRKRGTLEIYFDRKAEQTSIPFELKAKLERLSLTQAAADFYIYGVGLGYSNATSTGFANSTMYIKGYSHKILMAYAKQYADSIAKNPRVNGVWIMGGEEWWVNDKINRYGTFSSEPILARGLDNHKFYQSLSFYTGQNSWYGWLPVGGKVYGVKVVPNVGMLSDFEFNQRVISVDSVGFRLGNLTQVTQRKIAENIYRENQQYVITLAYNYLGPDKLVEKELKKNIDRIRASLPVGFSVKIPNRYWFSEKDVWSYYLIAVMLLLIYIISAALFESLVQPLAVIAVVPLSFIGTFLTYWMFNLPFDQGTFASFMLLGGLVVNSAIYIINEQNNLRKISNSSSIKIFLKALRFKFNPIILTILSTVMGLLPFVVFGEEPFWFSLAIGTIGGLTFSILILLIFMPVLPGVIKNKRL